MSIPWFISLALFYEHLGGFWFSTLTNTPAGPVFGYPSFRHQVSDAGPSPQTWCQRPKIHLSHFNLIASLPDRTEEKTETELEVPALLTLPAMERQDWGGACGRLIALLAPSSAASLGPSPFAGCSQADSRHGHIIYLSQWDKSKPDASWILHGSASSLKLLFCHENKPGLVHQGMSKCMKYHIQSHSRPASLQPICQLTQDIWTSPAKIRQSSPDQQNSIGDLQSLEKQWRALILSTYILVWFVMQQ